MSDQIKEWIRRHAEVQSKATRGYWETRGTGVVSAPLRLLVVPDDGSVLSFDADAIADAHRQFPKALDALEAVHKILSDHFEQETQREAKFGRTGSACVCEICQAMTAMTLALRQ